MDFSTIMSSQQQAVTKAQVDAANKALGKAVDTSSMGKQDFLQILITQLTNQDPLSPMEDKEFIAQMAQFSSLEQMTNMNNSFNELKEFMMSSRGVSLLGKNVKLIQGDRLIEGRVEAVRGQTNPEVLVGNVYYDINAIESVSE